MVVWVELKPITRKRRASFSEPTNCIYAEGGLRICVIMNEVSYYEFQVEAKGNSQEEIIEKLLDNYFRGMANSIDHIICDSPESMEHEIYDRRVWEMIGQPGIHIIYSKGCTYELMKNFSEQFLKDKFKQYKKVHKMLTS